MRTALAVFLVCIGVVSARRVDTCKLPADKGRCFAYFRRFFYNAATGKCEKFIYGGCGGNANRFITLEECEAACPPRWVDICKLPADQGPCKAHGPRFFYNAVTAKCEKFIYGGCLGNANRFNTLEECEAACPQRATRAQKPYLKKSYRQGFEHDKGPDFDVFCGQAPKMGNCLAAFERWFFNVNSGRCETFVYGGCGGNENSYMTKDECEASCYR
ncbi:BPTI/Kunitz domain-containing protein-like [Ornithodoros turicata]|uniref:BPTI/Kunitz domain-containing protein-like n=1 Tax=Ornithodoros turicata TaxID=34597 RepID=UPI003139281D